MASFHWKADVKASPASSDVMKDLLGVSSRQQPCSTLLFCPPTPSDDLFSSRCTHTHARTQVIYTVGSHSRPGDVHSLAVTHAWKDAHVSFATWFFCSERGLEGKPQHSSEEQQGLGEGAGGDLLVTSRDPAAAALLLFHSRHNPAPLPPSSRRCSYFTVLVVKKNSCHFGLKRRRQVRQRGAVGPGRGHNERWESVKSDYT